jgi:hypothetical protein
MATFIIGGLWHGAGWTFVFWGFLHGFALVIHRAWSKLGFKLWTWSAWFITFNFVNVAWVFFRAKEWDDAVKVLSGMINIQGVVYNIIYKDFYLLYISKPIDTYVYKYDMYFNTFLIKNILFQYMIILIGFILIFSNFKIYKYRKINLIFFIFLSLLLSIFATYFNQSLGGSSEFLYFQF